MAKRTIRLQLLEKFKCIGPECEASCCSYGWNISVDKSTLDKWRDASSKYPELHLMDSTTTNDDDPGEAKLKLEDNNCVLLSGNGMCSVQSTLGHEYIPKTCQDYPRVCSQIGNRQLVTLALSCPEVIRLMMAENKVQFIESSKPEKSLLVVKKEPTLPPEMSSLLERFVSQVMQQIKYPVSILLHFIASKIVELAVLSEKGELDTKSMQQSLKSVGQQLRDFAGNAENAASLNPASSLGRFWRLVYLMGVANKGYSASLMNENDPLLELLDDDNESEEKFQRISQYIEDYRGDLLKNEPAYFQNFMRNYLQMKFFRNDFPIRPVEGNLVAGFLFCLLPYAYIQLFVWARLRNTGKLNEEDIVEIVYKVERKFDHTDKIYQFLSKYPELLRLDKYLKSIPSV